MTITLTVDEVREFQQKLAQHYYERSAHLINWMLANPNDGFSSSGFFVSQYKQMTEAWDKTHPVPRLLPNL